MKKIQLGLVAVTTALLLTGCGEAKITGTPIKNVDSIAVTSAEDIDVFCPTGICTFELTASKPVTATVTMHYDYTKLYTKIEGVDVIGEGAKNAKVVDDDQFTVDISSADKPVKIQVIDYYRN
ncbi:MULTISPECIES: lipoprotein [unclassified Photobacterium]|uniref:LptM family lipoprotein n=1 Tax=unclassified Photobacterium TaxID=2628852 RepID=UPI000D170930|nr:MULTISPECIES: spore gernimation protein [unclassified Photobacterium]MCG3863382.1 spore gernimation protein [Photobacterium sp. Ph6]MCG3874911.1 spore gernimation protein [Photobacterium sp. Ph5]PSV27550.1 spore gernimation protein [Photobacterium sp. GB-56]PSV28569.1 spore gernimation protein [Photobacterium sp. GB-72]PSV34607.1 spore gernimation protein [Photobacterium sp. GB-210]